MIGHIENDNTYLVAALFYCLFYIYFIQMSVDNDIMGVPYYDLIGTKKEGALTGDKY